MSVVQISPETISVLKNFSQIQKNLLIPEGNELVTLHDSKTIMAVAEVSEKFPVRTAIWDLGQFLSVLSLFDKPEIEFTEKAMNIGSGRRRIKYYQCAEELLNTPKKKISFKSDFQVNIAESEIAEAIKAASVLSLPDLSIKSTGGAIRLIAHDKKNSTSNTFDLEVGEDCPNEFEANLRIEFLKLLPGDYTVSLSSKGISEFKHDVKNIRYYIALEPDSKF